MVEVHHENHAKASFNAKAKRCWDYQLPPWGLRFERSAKNCEAASGITVSEPQDGQMTCVMSPPGAVFNEKPCDSIRASAPLW
jgi:hypothetical protein